MSLARLACHLACYFALPILLSILLFLFFAHFLLTILFAILPIFLTVLLDFFFFFFFCRGLFVMVPGIKVGDAGGKRGKRAAIALQLKEGLLRLGPTFIKLGQLLSTRCAVSWSRWCKRMRIVFFLCALVHVKASMVAVVSVPRQWVVVSHK